jgi:hypothetical protein
MRPLSVAHTSKGAADWSASEHRGGGGPALRLAICMQISADPANLHQPGRPGGLRAQQLSVHIGPLCPRPGFVGAEAAQHLHLRGGRWQDLAAIWKFA